MVTPQQESSTPITILERIPSGEATTYLVPSDSDPAAAYSLVAVRHRPMSCTCKGYTYYQRACKHMTRLAAYLERPHCAKCSAPTPQLCPDGWCAACCSADDAHKSAKGQVA